MIVLNRDKWNISTGLDGSEESEESKSSEEIIHMSRSCVLGILIFQWGTAPGTTDLLSLTSFEVSHAE